MESGLVTIFNEALTATTQYAPSAQAGAYGLEIQRMHDVGLVIAHPAGATTEYTVQVCNMTETQIQRGGARWADYLVIGSKSAEEVFYVDLDDPCFARMRLVAVTSIAAGDLVIDACTKGR